METKKVIILDRNLAYSQTLQAALNQEFSEVCSFEALPSSGTENLQGQVIICEPSFLPDLADKQAQVVCLIHNSASASAAEKTTSFHRKQKLSEICRVIRQGLANLPDDSSTKADNPLILLNGFQDGARAKQRQDLLSAYQKEAYDIFYLPLMPAYQLNLDLHFSEGPDLTGYLVYLLSQESAGSSFDLSNCFQYFNGIWCPRLKGGPDDLVQQSSELLYQLARDFRSMVKNRTCPSVGLIECHYLPLSTIENLICLCDYWHCDLPTGQSYASRMANQAIADLLARLPENVKFKPRKWESAHVF